MRGADPLAKAQQKIRVWKHEADQAPVLVNLQGGYDLTTHPSEPRASFPGLTPFRVLTAAEVFMGKDRIVCLPSVGGTALVSACVGAVVALLLFLRPLLSGLSHDVRSALSRAAQGGGPGSGYGWNGRWRAVRSSLGSIVSLLRLAVCAVVGLWFHRFVKSRHPRVRVLSRYADVSGSPDKGPCIVADRVLMITNSHAGTHADMPAHFVRCPASSTSSSFLADVGSGTAAYPSVSLCLFDEAHYTGEAVVVDIAQELAELSFETNAITVEVMDRALGKLPRDYLNGTRQLWRLVFVTRRLRIGPASVQDAQWDPCMAYFVPEAVEFLCHRFPLLLLLGTDAASVDAPTASPICDHAHGTLLRHGVAILENLRCDELYSSLTACGGPTVLEGSLLTVFNPAFAFEDARGCSVIFCPRHTPPHS